MASAQNSTVTQSTSPEDNHDVEIISVVITFSSLSMAALSLRLLSLRLKKVYLHSDDYLVMASWVIMPILPLPKRD